jgi:transposase, IS30 family
VKTHKRLTLIDRELLLKLSVQFYTQSQMAEIIGCSQPAISREMRRYGMNRSTYSFAKAQVDRNIKVARNGRKKKLIKGKKLLRIIEGYLSEHWSPEQVSNVLKKHSKSPRQVVSHETIYKYIYSITDMNERNKWIKYLRQKRRKRRSRHLVNEKRGPISGAVSIHKRPKHIEDREEVGHWEGDTVVGKDHKSAIGTLVERKSRFTLIIPLHKGKTSEFVVQGFEEELKNLPPHLRRTLTYDNGAEMALHNKLKQSLGIDVYFADPGSPGQRGTNENTNGLIREFFPKGTDFSKVTVEAIKHVQNLLNQRPRKVLRFATPYQKLWEKKEVHEPPDKRRPRAVKKAAGDLVLRH